jgi:TonB family protein
VAEYRPPEEQRAKKFGVIAVGGALLLVCSFLIGMLINREDAPKRAPETLEEQAAEHRQEAAEQLRAQTPLIPVAGPAGVDQPITSAPVSAPGAVPGQQSRTDATAVSSVEYAEMARRAAAEKRAAAGGPADPRTIVGEPYAQRPSSSGGAAQRVASRAVSTRPVPQHQPLPHIDGRGRARLRLTVGPDGRVRDVNVERPLERNNSRLVRAVQSWRFKPATVNGRPVAAPYAVEIKYER